MQSNNDPAEKMRRVRYFDHLKEARQCLSAIRSAIYEALPAPSKGKGNWKEQFDENHICSLVKGIAETTKEKIHSKILENFAKAVGGKSEESDKCNAMGELAIALGLALNKIDDMSSPSGQYIRLNVKFGKAETVPDVQQIFKDISSDVINKFHEAIKACVEDQNNKTSKLISGVFHKKTSAVADALKNIDFTTKGMKQQAQSIEQGVKTTIGQRFQTSMKKMEDHPNNKMLKEHSEKQSPQAITSNKPG